MRKIYGSHLKSVILYGSYARGDYTKDSDIDIMILVDLPDEKLDSYLDSLSELGFQYNVEKFLLLQERHKWNERYCNKPCYLRRGIVQIHRSALRYLNYIHTEIFPKELGRKIITAEEIRHASDYDTFYIASKDAYETRMFLWVLRFFAANRNAFSIAGVSSGESSSNTISLFAASSICLICSSVSFHHNPCCRLQWLSNHY